jgi:hypothetical protein
MEIMGKVERATRRETMQRALNVQTERWSAMSADQLIAELRDEQNYIIKGESSVYQFEVQLLENTDTYVHVSVAVDDGRLWYSISPLSTTSSSRNDIRSGSCHSEP